MSSELVAEMTEGMRERIGDDCGLGKSLKIDFGDDGVIHLDATRVPNVISNDDKAADCTIKVSVDVFQRIAAGELDGTAAFMAGQLAIDGDMSVAMMATPLLQARA